METLGLGLKDVGVPILGGHLRNLVPTQLRLKLKRVVSLLRRAGSDLGGSCPGLAGHIVEYTETGPS